MMHRVGGIAPLIPSAPVLVLAGGVGPLSSIPVQMFYRWCSRNYVRVYTILDSQDVGQRILPNIHVLNDSSHYVAGIHISGDKYNHEADILVHDTPRTFPQVQIHSVGVFNFAEHGTRHVANSFQKGFDRTAALELQ